MDIGKLQELIEKAAAVQAERLALDRQSKELKKQEDLLKADASQAMLAMGLTAYTAHSGHTANIKRSVEPLATDWNALLEHIRETGSTDLLQKRLTPSAVKLRWADGLAVPGVDAYEEVKLVIT